VTTPALLAAEDLWVNYGSAKALFGVSLAMEPGDVVAILGANGAGKSTLGKSLCGLVAPSKGRVTFLGTDVTGWPAHRVSRLGLDYLPEGRGIFPTLSVLDNLRMFLRRGSSRRERDRKVGTALEMFPILAERRHQRAGTLSGGEQQMLALARVLAQPPRLVIADEPSLGLAPIVIDRVFEMLDLARQQGVAIILIEQFVDRALEFADRCVILERGKTTWNGRTEDARGEVLDRYFGGEEAGDGAAGDGDPANGLGPVAHRS
jgi:branched-chain amino acid transport system ATP-binding protein